MLYRYRTIREPRGASLLDGQYAQVVIVLLLQLQLLLLLLLLSTSLLLLLLLPALLPTAMPKPSAVSRIDEPAPLLRLLLPVRRVL